MHNNNKMKISELQEIIRKSIAEVIEETTYAGKGSVNTIKSDPKYNSLSQTAKTNVATDLTQGKDVELNEDDIDEMANVSVTYQLADDADAAAFTGKKNRIITAMQATGEPMSKIDVAGELGYNKQNPINADFMELVASGAIVPAGQQAAPRLNRPAAEPAADGEEQPPVDSDYDFLRGDMTDAEVDASFAQAAAAGEEEPEMGDLEATPSMAANQISDDDYEAFMKAIDLERRLSATKSNILKLRKDRPGVGDIKDKPSDELQRLRTLKISLEKRIDDLYASSKYLQKRQEKSTGKAYVPPIDPEEIEDEETEPIDEWTKNKMKFYAGIIK